MRSFILRCVIVILITILWVDFTKIFLNSAPQPLQKLVRENLRNRIESAGIPPKLVVGEEIIHASVVLPSFYEQRIYSPAWINDEGPLPQVYTLINAVSEAGKEGLRPQDYHLDKIQVILREVQQNQEKRRPFYIQRLVDLDLLLTDAFLIYGSHLIEGKVDPEKIDAEWLASRREKDMAQVLEIALNKNQIGEALGSLLPQHPGYRRLRQALAYYRNVAVSGGWLSIAEGPKMKKGDRSERVIELRRRLLATGDLGFLKESGTNLFDCELEQAVRRFQEQHGLGVDGIVGSSTLAALNVPAEERIHQIELNMERWRWLPQDLGLHYILVNIANFELEVVRKNDLMMLMRVVVGKDYRRTPVLSAKMTYIVLNPYWHIPKKIAVEDMLPLIRKDISYLEKQRIRVFHGWGPEEEEIDPENIDWEKVDGESFPYRLRQDIGPWNALGRVKFMFPNKFSVYFHDTPSKELFAKTSRTFSSGCIRIEKPIELATYLLQDDPSWTRANILAAIDKGAEQTIRLKESVLVHLLYWTAWAEEDGSIQFRNDIYSRDKRLYEALREKSPTSLEVK
jgi:murein L,D-transpeptidase YcbB/YkuD